MTVLDCLSANVDNFPRKNIRFPVARIEVLRCGNSSSRRRPDVVFPVEIKTLLSWRKIPISPTARSWCDRLVIVSCPHSLRQTGSRRHPYTPKKGSSAAKLAIAGIVSHNEPVVTISQGMIWRFTANRRPPKGSTVMVFTVVANETPFPGCHPGAERGKVFGAGLTPWPGRDLTCPYPLGLTSADCYSRCRSRSTALSLSRSR